MTPAARRVTAAGLIALAVGAGCNSSERQAAAAARNSAEVAASPQQKQLWQDAADKGAPGLERVPVPQEPVRTREHLQVPTGQSKPVPAQPIKIPERVLSQIRILTYPKDPFASYMGPATVLSAKDDFIELNLGQAGTLAVLARADGKPLPVAKNDEVNVFYQAREVPEVPNDVIAIRTKSGAGIAHVIRGDDKAVQLFVPLFNVNVNQLDKPGLPVNIFAPGFKDDTPFSMGVTTSAGNLKVRIVGSTRFTLNVLVWRNP